MHFGQIAIFLKDHSANVYFRDVGRTFHVWNLDDSSLLWFFVVGIVLTGVLLSTSEEK